MQSSYFVRLREGTTNTYETIQNAFSNDSLSHAQVLH
jgi:hypothetical protein